MVVFMILELFIHIRNNNVDSFLKTSRYMYVFSWMINQTGI